MRLCVGAYVFVFAFCVVQHEEMGTAS